ncbi:hypothetical protein F5Y16DRAFT_406402 [Xylariaceae sp. FL0255]|nr:hypothetical protein F5Y16DRAFT_406402 [Xylariaceae sp. FL0255]
MAHQTYDFVIVGGGTAGLVIGSRLSEDPKLRVVIIESGEDQTKKPEALTPGMWMTLANGEMDWAFDMIPQKHIEDPTTTFPQGRALGGSSTINSFMFTPTSKVHIDTIAKLGNSRWDFATFQDAMKKSVTIHSSSGTKEGTGPVQLRLHESEVENNWVNIWSESLQSIGFPKCDPFSGQVCGSFKHFESIDPATNLRSGSANAYLPQLHGRPNVTILTSSTVSKILLAKTDAGNVIARGVQVIIDASETITIKADKEIILAAGAISSPRLLENSGIGDASLLQRLGIDVIIDNPNVGENFQNHIFTGVCFQVRDDVKTLDPFFRQEPAAVQEAMEAYSRGAGPLASSSLVASAQLPLPDSQTIEVKEVLSKLLDAPMSSGTGIEVGSSSSYTEVQKAFVRDVLESPTEASAHYMLGPAYSPWEEKDQTYRVEGNYISILVMLSYPLSRGSTHITSANSNLAEGNEGLSIDPKHLSHPLDLEIAARHVQFAEQVLAKAEPLASKLEPREDRFADLDKAKEYVRKTAKGAYHYTGTCSMMSRDMGGVVDDQLRVYGCKNLRVCDASIIPIEPRANTQAVVYGVAEMGARLIQGSI